LFAQKHGFNSNYQLNFKFVYRGPNPFYWRQMATVGDHWRKMADADDWDS
jgi:hypothetical protein